MNDYRITSDMQAHYDRRGGLGAASAVIALCAIAIVLYVLMVIFS